MRLSVRALAIAAGFIWGFGIFFITLWIMLLDGATHEVTLIGRVYRGYEISLGGAFVGLLWGLADGAVGGAIFAWLYNRFLPAPRA